MAGEKEQTILTFQRTEVKYRMSRAQYQGFMEHTKMLRVPDEAYPHSLILNIYYDTEHDELVTRSLDKPVYKEKLRVRSYGIPGKRSPVFVELKKKYDGIVYKRRSEMSLREAENFLQRGIRPALDSQINRELEYFRAFYRPHPAMVLCYDRDSYQGAFDPNFRMTIDLNIRYREQDLRLEDGDGGSPLRTETPYLMELKVGDALPIEMARILSELRIFPASFSKYGEAYRVSHSRADVSVQTACR